VCENTTMELIYFGENFTLVMSGTELMEFPATVIIYCWLTETYFDLNYVYSKFKRNFILSFLCWYCSFPSSVGWYQCFDATISISKKYRILNSIVYYWQRENCMGLGQFNSPTPGCPFWQWQLRTPLLQFQFCNFHCDYRPSTGYALQRHCK